MKLTFDQTISYAPEGASGQMRFEKDSRPPIDFSEADVANLSAGGYAHLAESELEATTEEGDEPAGGSGQEDTNANTSGTGSNASTEPPADETALVCAKGCNGGRAFKSAAAFAAHRISKLH